MSECPYCGDNGCPYCMPVKTTVTSYTTTDINGNEVELTEEEYLAIGEENAVKSLRIREPNYPWEKI